MYEDSLYPLNLNLGIWDSDCEPASLGIWVNRAFNCYFTVVAFDDLLNDGKAKPRAIASGCKEWLENLVLMLRSNPMPVVRYPDYQFA